MLLIRNNCESGFATIAEQVSQLLRGNKYKSEEIKEEALQVETLEMCITAHSSERMYILLDGKRTKADAAHQGFYESISLNKCKETV